MLTEKEVITMLRAQMGSRWGDVKAWAIKHDIPYQTVTHVINGNTKPNEAILRLLGLKRVESYVPIEKKPDPNAETP